MKEFKTATALPSIKTRFSLGLPNFCAVSRRLRVLIEEIRCYSAKIDGQGTKLTPEVQDR
jgi:hypothetical protein